MNRTLLGLLFAMSLVAASVPSAARAPADDDDDARGPDGEVAKLVDKIEADRIQETIEKLEAFGTRHSCSGSPAPGRGVTPARDYIFKRFSQIKGLEVRLDPFRQASCPTAPTFNVVAWLPGTVHPERLVIIGGHYDSRTIDVNDSVSDAPGANDSGSQSSLVLETAKVLSHARHPATLVFITFSGEEQGLFGSGSIAANLTRYFPNAAPVAMLNTDIVGGDNLVNGAGELRQFRLYSPGTPRETGLRTPDGSTDNTSPARGLMRFIGTWGLPYVPSMQMLPKLREDRPGRASDHRSFLNTGIPAVRFMDTVECSPSPVDNSCGGALPCPPPASTPVSCTSFDTSHQHSPGDQSQFVTASYTARIAQIVAATAASLARAPLAPGHVNVIGNASAGVTMSWTAPANDPVVQYVIAARATTENFYRNRVIVTETTRAVAPAELGLAAGESFFISVAAVDAKGHESLFAYPEFRCDAAACAIPPGALDVTVRK